MLAELTDRAVIAVSGPEARSFLQGLITNDVERLAPGLGLYAALLTPQGKILFDFFLVEGDAAILIDCHASARDALLKRLTMYKLRAKVTLEPRDQLAVLAGWDEPLPGAAIVYPDPRPEALGARAIIAKGEMPEGLTTVDEYHRRRLARGVPEAADFGSDRMFALDADLDELNAIDFKKGCYVGQELTARMKHRATSRKRLLPVRSANAWPIPAPGIEVHAAGKKLGEIIATHGHDAFALVRLDHLDEIGDAPINAGGNAVELIKPAWLFA